jgi:hypothetical protein
MGYLVSGALQLHPEYRCLISTQMLLAFSGVLYSCIQIFICNLYTQLISIIREVHLLYSYFYMYTPLNRT